MPVAAMPRPEPRFAILLMGPSGCGKTTVGRLLAERALARFVDADDFHSLESREKMRSGQPLTDEERRPWLAELKRELESSRLAAKRTVLACSALKASYRSVLLDGGGIELALLDVPAAELGRRLANRPGHFAGPPLLPSQLATLERPSEELVLDGTLPPEVLARTLFERLGW